MKKYFVETYDPDDYITQIYIKCNSLEQVNQNKIKVDHIEIEFNNEVIQKIKEVDVEG